MRSLVNGEHIIAIAGRTVMLKDEATDDAMEIENTFLSNMGSAAETVKEKASEFMNSTADMTKRLSANIGEKMEKMKKRDEDFNNGIEIAEDNAAPIEANQQPAATASEIPEEQTGDAAAATGAANPATESAGADAPDADENNADENNIDNDKDADDSKKAD